MLGLIGDKNPFSPKFLPNLKLWLDASQITGLADGVAVSQWNDLSGNGYHATQGTSGNRPVYKTGIQNGLPVVRFTAASSHWLGFSNDALPAQNHTVFVVYKANSTALGKFILGRAYYAGALYLSVMANNDATNPSKARHVVDSANAYSTVAGDSAWMVISAVYDSTTNDLRINNGDLVQTANAAGAIDYDSRDLATIGAFRATAAAPVSFFDGDLAEIVLCDAALSAGQRHPVMEYLARKWNIRPAA